MDYKSGIEAMILAILQQTERSLSAQQAQMLALQLGFLNAHASSASIDNLITLYAAFLAEALAANANLTLAIESGILHLNSSESLLPVSACVGLSLLLAKCKRHDVS